MARKRPLPFDSSANPAMGPFVCDTDTVMVMAWPGATVEALAVTVTVGSAPPLWHPVQPDEAMPNCRADAGAAASDTAAAATARAARRPAVLRPIGADDTGFTRRAASWA